MKMNATSSRGISANSHSANNSFGPGPAPLNYKSSAAQGQENRRPLLHRIFGASGQTTKQPQSAVVGGLNG